MNPAEDMSESLLVEAAPLAEEGASEVNDVADEGTRVAWGKISQAWEKALPELRHAAPGLAAARETATAGWIAIGIGALAVLGAIGVLSDGSRSTTSGVASLAFGLASGGVGYLLLLWGRRSEVRELWPQLVNYVEQHEHPSASLVVLHHLASTPDPQQALLGHGPSVVRRIEQYLAEHGRLQSEVARLLPDYRRYRERRQSREQDRCLRELAQGEQKSQQRQQEQESRKILREQTRQQKVAEWAAALLASDGNWSELPHSPKLEAFIVDLGLLSHVTTAPAASLTVTLRLHPESVILESYFTPDRRCVLPDDCLRSLQCQGAKRDLIDQLLQLDRVFLGEDQLFYHVKLKLWVPLHYEVSGDLMPTATIHLKVNPKEYEAFEPALAAFLQCWSPGAGPRCPNCPDRVLEDSSWYYPAKFYCRGCRTTWRFQYERGCFVPVC